MSAVTAPARSAAARSPEPPPRTAFVQAGGASLGAATDPGVLGGQYYGPGGFFGARGYPELAESSRQSHDTAIQRRLWTASEELTGVTFPV